MELFQALGISWKILLAQFVNFAVLVFVLWKFAYTPIFKFLEERRKKIEEGVDNAEKASQRLIEIAEKEKEAMIEAKKEALSIINEAKDNAEKRANDIIKKGQEEASLAMLKEREKFSQEKEEAFKDMKSELSSLVVLSVEKIIKEKLDSDKDKELINQSLENK